MKNAQPKRNQQIQSFTQGVDMRKGIECLCEIVHTYHLNPLNGEIYVFTNKSRHLLKMLHWERGG